jgi:carboxylesterase type B
VFRDGCVQDCVLPPHTCPLQTSEDCLYLNVFRPTQPPADGKVCVVFFFFFFSVARRRHIEFEIARI